MPISESSISPTFDDTPWQEGTFGELDTTDMNSPEAVMQANSDGTDYNIKSFSYPLDIGTNPQYNHYVIFNINVSDNTRYATGYTSYDNSPKGTFHPSSSNPIFGTEIPTVDNQSFGESEEGNGLVRRITHRVSTAIALYMPNQIQDDTQHDWQGRELGIPGEVLSDWLNHDRGTPKQDVQAGINALKAGTLAMFTDAGLKAIEKALGDGGKQTVLAYTRFAVNPHLEVLYNGTNFRTFTFDWRFTPRTPDEAQTVANIIRAFRFYAAPELNVTSFTGSKFFGYPAEFDIKFFSNGKENNWLNRITTCVLKDIRTNFTPNNMWTALRKGHSTEEELNGVGVETELTLVFQEEEIITKRRTAQGF